MNIRDAHAATKRIKKLIEKKVFVRAKDEPIISKRSGTVRQDGWLFDFRRILMSADALEDISDIFWHTFKHPKKIQVCGLEVAAIPLVTGIMLGAQRHEDKNGSGFFIRKSRKKDGLMRMIEGVIQDNRDIILVDDIVHSGKSLVRQVEVLEELGHSVRAVWTILRFRDKKH